MASLKCSNCGFGIHYHDEPNGVEWIVFEMDTWNKLCASTKPISSYEIDTKSGWYTIWECTECGTLHLFKAMDIHIDKAFVLQDTNVVHVQDGKNTVCIAFDDITWDQVTETAENGNSFDIKFKDVPRKYLRFYENALYVYADADFSFIKKVYQELPK